MTDRYQYIVGKLFQYFYMRLENVGQNNLLTTHVKCDTFHNTNVLWFHKSLFCRIHTSFGGRRRNTKLQEDIHMFIELFAVPSTS